MDDRFPTLHAVRVRGLAPADVLSADDVTRLVAEGFLAERSGRVAGFVLTAAGRELHESLLAKERATLDIDTLAHAYRVFVELNREFLREASAWQARVTDGIDPDGVERLSRIHEQVLPICRESETVVARFGDYRPRLAHALERLRAGEESWFTSPAVDSYHTVWFQLHEDFLATLGLDRVSEGAG